jgi:predicted ATP-dependent Lon-type protease
MKHLKLTFSDIMQSKILYYDEEVEEAEMGNKSIGGPVERAMNFADKVTLLLENGAKTLLVPMENINEMLTITQSILS